VLTADDGQVVLSPGMNAVNNGRGRIESLSETGSDQVSELQAIRRLPVQAVDALNDPGGRSRINAQTAAQRL
jgi:hypothetical protein